MIKTTLTATVGKISSNNNNNNNNIPRHHLTVYSWLFLIPASKGAVRERDADVDEVEVSKQDDDVKFFNLSFVSPWPPYDWSFFFSLFARKESQFFFFCAGALCHFLFILVRSRFTDLGLILKLNSVLSIVFLFFASPRWLLRRKGQPPKTQFPFSPHFFLFVSLFYFLFFFFSFTSFFSSTTVFFLFFHCFLFGYFRRFMRFFRECVFKCQIWVRIKVQISI